MLEKETITKREEFESKQNLVGLFKVFVKVDRRINPKNYIPRHREVEENNEKSTVDFATKS